MSPCRESFRPKSRLGLALLLILSQGCGGDGVVNPAGDGTGDGPSKGLLSLDVILAPEHSSVAEELGWTDGVPYVTIEFARVDQYEYDFITVVTDSTGHFVLPELDPGFYWVAAEKAIPDSLLDGSSLEGTGVQILGGGAKFRLSSTTVLEARSISVELRPNQPSGVVFSELYPTSPASFETGDEWLRGSIYVEVYNGSDLTVFMDGMILGKAYRWWLDASEFGHHACGDSEALRTDPAGIWSMVYWRFPGGGAEYPLNPGEVKLIAVNAQDHTNLHPAMMDLSDADFEMLQPGSADNPGVPNLDYVAPQAHDLGDLGFPWAFYFLSRPVDLEALPSGLDPAGTGKSGFVFRRFPRSEILDVVYVWHDSDNTPRPFCTDPVYPSFDALPGEIFRGVTRGEGFVSNQRRIVGTRNGLPLLLDTNTSKVDFVKGERTPGWVSGG
jgi:hypothetical protein